MKKTILLTTCAVIGVVGYAQAISVALDASNQGIGSISVSINDNLKIITITENWTGTGPGVLRFTDLDPNNQLWTIQKIINNNSGSAWSRLANELLDWGVDSNDPSQPAFVPSGFSTSANGDGLSFAQGYTGYPRTSTAFASVLADEITNNRDFLDFYNGTLANGATDNFMTFGLQTPFSNGDEPILLMQRPNAYSSQVPEAGATLTLLALALSGLGGLRRARH